jgi:hypothetical protein
MNGISRTNPGEPREDDGLDPHLLRLFDSVPPLENEGAFVAATVARLVRARRAQLIRRLSGTVIIMAVAAVVAPYVARLTLTAMDWFIDHLPETGVALASPIGCVCAALIAWRIARRQFN